MNPVMYQGEIYYDAIEDDCLAALPIHDEYPHNIKFYTPIAKCMTSVFFFFKVTGFKMSFSYSKY